MNSDEENQKRDSNANINTIKSRGAVPKTKSNVRNKATQKKTFTLNNHIHPSSISCDINSDYLKMNGVVNYLSSICLDEKYSLDKVVNILNKTNKPTNDICLKDINSTIKFYNKVPQCSSLSKNIILSNTSLNDSRTYTINHRRKWLNLTNSSNSSEEDLHSLSDDGYVYKYKGDEIADLPNSFYNLEIHEIPMQPNKERSESSSPDMDFLEMDFDPGSLGDGDSESGEFQNTASVDKENDKKCKSNKIKPYSKESTNLKCKDYCDDVNKNVDPEQSQEPEEITEENRSDLFSQFRCFLGRKEQREEIKDSVMIWLEKEALLRQFTQIGPSACGATAVLNVLAALRFPIPSIETLNKCISTRLRANSSPLTEYLLSRSNAGCTHNDIIEGLNKVSDGKIYARFFHMYPERDVNLELWLAFWIRNGAIPVATLNLQKCAGTIPDAWHHQMIFGVSPRGIFLTNPFECVQASKLWPQLSSESVLLVKKEDVLSRWKLETDLPKLMSITDVRWRRLNVVGENDR